MSGDDSSEPEEMSSLETTPLRKQQANGPKDRSTGESSRRLGSYVNQLLPRARPSFRMEENDNSYVPHVSNTNNRITKDPTINELVNDH
jgi:hypothetical protein